MNIGFIGQRYSTQSPQDLHDRMVGFFEAAILENTSPDDRFILATGAGVDLPMIEAVKRTGRKALLVVPFPNHTERWPASLQSKFYELADGLPSVTLADGYAYGVYDMRNRHIAHASDDPLWVFWDGTGDDGFCRVLGIVALPGLAHRLWNLAGNWGER